jgi:hypothetical protein
MISSQVAAAGSLADAKLLEGMCCVKTLYPDRVGNLRQLAWAAVKLQHAAASHHHGAAGHSRRAGRESKLAGASERAIDVWQWPEPEPLQPRQPLHLGAPLTDPQVC